MSFSKWVKRAKIRPLVGSKRHIGGKSGAPGGIRTPDPRFRRPMLYPLSYRRRQATSKARGTYRWYLNPLCTVKQGLIGRTKQPGHRTDMWKAVFSEVFRRALDLARCHLYVVGQSQESLPGLTSHR